MFKNFPLWVYVKLIGDVAMYHDEIFEQALKDVQTESYKALKDEINTMEVKIERLLKNVLESSTFKAERDFNITAV